MLFRSLQHLAAQGQTGKGANIYSQKKEGALLRHPFDFFF